VELLTNGTLVTKEKCLFLRLTDLSGIFVHIKMYFLSQQYETWNKISKIQFSRLQSCKMMSASCDFAVCVHPILTYLQTLQ